MSLRRNEMISAIAELRKELQPNARMSANERLANEITSYCDEQLEQHTAKVCAHVDNAVMDCLSDGLTAGALKPQLAAAVGDALPNLVDLAAVAAITKVPLSRVFTADLGEMQEHLASLTLADALKDMASQNLAIIQDFKKLYTAHNELKVQVTEMAAMLQPFRAKVNQKEESDATFIVTPEGEIYKKEMADFSDFSLPPSIVPDDFSEPTPERVGCSEADIAESIKAMSLEELVGSGEITVKEFAGLKKGFLAATGVDNHRAELKARLRQKIKEAKEIDHRRVLKGKVHLKSSTQSANSGLSRTYKGEIKDVKSLGLELV
jgi:hypothetical protein